MVKQRTQHAEDRASIYWWLSTLFAHELSAEALNRYFGPDGQAFLTGLEETQSGQDGSKALQRLKSAVAVLQLMKQPHLELAAEFSQAFLGDNRTSALPYASVYLSEGGLLFQQPHQEMLDLLQQQGLAVTEQFKEPADHLAIMLDYLGNHVMRLVEAKTDAERNSLYREQLDFIEQRLLTWVPQFNQRLQGIAGTGFYAAVADYLCDFLTAEKSTLV